MEIWEKRKELRSGERQWIQFGYNEEKKKDGSEKELTI